MRALSTARAERARKTDRPIETATDQTVENALADVAKALWPENTAPFLAAELNCEVRSVERYLEGSRKWSGDAVALIVAEILKRHRMRNVRVIPRN